MYDKDFGHGADVTYYELLDSTKLKELSNSVTYGVAEPINSPKSSADVIKSPIEKLALSFAMSSKVSLTSVFFRLFFMIELK